MLSSCRTLRLLISRDFLYMDNNCGWWSLVISTKCSTSQHKTILRYKVTYAITEDLIHIAHAYCQLCVSSWTHIRLCLCLRWMRSWLLWVFWSALRRAPTPSLGASVKDWPSPWSWSTILLSCSLMSPPGRILLTYFECAYNLNINPD